MKVKDLSITDLMNYYNATDALLSHYDNLVILNKPDSVEMTLSENQYNSLLEYEKHALKCRCIKEIIRDEMFDRISKLC